MLQWRVDFARLVLRMELECTYLAKPSIANLWRPWELHAGERTPEGTYIKKFLHVDKNAEGVEMEGGSALFDK